METHYQNVAGLVAEEPDEAERLCTGVLRVVDVGESEETDGSQ